MTSNGKQFTVTRSTVPCRPLLHVMAGISARFSNFAFVLFCYIANHLMTDPLGNSEFCFPRISMFPSTSSRETLRFSGIKIHCSPRDQYLSVYCCSRRPSWPPGSLSFESLGNGCKPPVDFDEVHTFSRCINKNPILLLARDILYFA